MDKNSITGIVLITLILGFAWWYNKPTEEQIAEQKRVRDSIEQVELVKIKAEQQARELQAQQELIEKEAAPVDSAQIAADLNSKFGLFSSAANGTEEFVTLENDVVKITLTSKGARIYSVELKEYQAHDGRPVILMDGDQNKFGFNFIHNSRVFHTNELYFEKVSAFGNKVDFVVNAAEGKMTFSYSLPENGYMADFNISTSNLQNIIATNSGSLELDWTVDVMAQEKGVKFERQRSGVYYLFDEKDVDDITATSSDSEDLRTKLKWVAFKDQFFSSVFISKDQFLSGQVSLEIPEDQHSQLIMSAATKVAVPYTGNDNLDFNFFFGPNDFKALKPYEEDLHLRELVYLGWGPLRVINLGVIEVFHFFERFISSYGIIILVLTILIKLLLFPLTYKSYISTAKMKVLKPQIEEINNKIPKEKSMERQQATMALYRKAGVNPMGGCLPMLLQMPILFAMFQFFPASIELRGESFLWATDLSSFDSIYSWDKYIPYVSDYFGNHISLFCLLMSITNIVYTKINQDMTQSSQQMPGMKGMMYMMPVMFLVFFNNYASGLSYYYFISTLITIGQTLLIRRFVDEEALLAKLKANQKKPVKKSNFQKRLEDMQKQQKQKTGKKRR